MYGRCFESFERKREIPVGGADMDASGFAAVGESVEKFATDLRQEHIGHQGIYLGRSSRVRTLVRAKVRSRVGKDCARELLVRRQRCVQGKCGAWRGR